MFCYSHSHAWALPWAVGPATPDQWELQLGGVLDVGVSPTELLRCVRARFEAAGGLSCSSEQP